nr:NADAR family protein [Permianibacter fluminis]
MIKNLSELEDYLRLGGEVNYLFFWGHQGKGVQIGKSCLSQWYEAPFFVEEVRYPSAEHYMMAEKARLFVDEAIRAKVIEAKTPGAAKAFGREVKGFNEVLWQAQRFEIVVAANQHKFEQNAQLAEYLLATGNKVLVEASPVDRVWGIGLAEADLAARNPKQWQGLNLLGFALMVVRANLQAKSA